MRNGTPLVVLLSCLVACSGDRFEGTYAGTASGTFIDMSAPAADGTGTVESANLSYSWELVVRRTGTDRYELVFAGCRLQAESPGRTATFLNLAPGQSCTLPIAGRGEVVISSLAGQPQFNHDHSVQWIITGEAPVRADGMRPQLSVSFNGQKSR